MNLMGFAPTSALNGWSNASSACRLGYRFDLEPSPNCTTLTAARKSFLTKFAFRFDSATSRVAVLCLLYNIN